MKGIVACMALGVMLLCGTAQAVPPSQAVPHQTQGRIEACETSGNGMDLRIRRPLSSRSGMVRPKMPPKVAPKPPQPAGRTMTVEARAYALRGYTSQGTYTTHGTIAVDPRVIPYGSRIYVPGYGWGKALDCGGAIVGRSIDLWMPTTGQCYQWGVRVVRITVYPPARHNRKR